MLCVQIILGNCLGTELGALFRNNCEVVLTAVRNTSRALLWASDELRSNNIFVMRCVQESGNLKALRFCIPPLQREDFEHSVRESILTHHNFRASSFMDALFDVTTSSQLKTASSCKLSNLNVGKETTQAIMALVLQFASVPCGKELKLCKSIIQIFSSEKSDESESSAASDSDSDSDSDDSGAEWSSDGDERDQSWSEPFEQQREQQERSIRTRR
jgi:hypothetical protein